MADQKPLVLVSGGIRQIATGDTVPVANGGTGATTAANARTNLGAVSKAGDSMTGNLTIAPLTGTAGLILNVNGMATNNVAILGQDSGSTRWVIELGASSSGAFVLSRFNGATYLNSPISINWSTGAMTFIGATTFVGQIASETTARINGYFAKQGVSGAFGGNSHNWNWTGSAIQAWVDSTNVGTVSLTSDERVKHSVFDLTPDRAAYLLIRPKTFHYRDIGIFTDNGEHWGFSAQNLLTCMPKAVHGSPDATLEDGTPRPMSVEDRPILAQTVLQVQALIAENTEFRALVMALTARLDALAPPSEIL
ncbi:tail fiber domain-containing protein [Variovorax sp. DXTD-1]|uniref:tail fiber domain-containing protein n=1 Tax=Variovorax sp. DXTD-1 TaxID=2495592 RepID=UPI000F880D2A|nr:tail fiber domain-containing protein [Variovorax sp. DXTD-1]RST54097.1 tail fiber domain-containing protein [Variovorax sp. DXTD-1]